MAPNPDAGPLSGAMSYPLALPFWLSSDVFLANKAPQGKTFPLLKGARAKKIAIYKPKAEKYFQTY